MKILGLTAMKKGKHTSGPWKVYHQELRKQFPGHKIIEVQDDHGNAVVQWSGFDNSDRLKKVHLANARLIAAAPKLLAACEEFVSKYPADSSITPKMKAAIAKAYGK